MQGNTLKPEIKYIESETEKKEWWRGGGSDVPHEDS
jgi:hypothetical protein